MSSVTPYNRQKPFGDSDQSKRDKNKTPKRYYFISFEGEVVGFHVEQHACHFKSSTTRGDFEPFQVH
jgi:hypothetical protein